MAFDDHHSDNAPSSFQALQSSVLASYTEIPNKDNTCLDSVIYDAYKNGGIQEPIYGTDRIIASESLARPKDSLGRQYSIGLLSEQFYKQGHAVNFDILTTSNALKQAQTFPVSINISVTSALSPHFWKETKKRMEREEIAPNDIVFEILEHDVDPAADISILEDLKENDFRFALDDFIGNEFDEHRLAAFANLVEFIKIEGKVIRGGLGDKDMEYTPEDLERAITMIEYNAPDAKLIAERVRSFEEAQTLFDRGFVGVQGRQLNAEDFHYTPEAQAIALEKGTTSCEY